MEFQQIITAIFVSAAASLLGSFAILKRMALVGDALSHVALPGIALALIFNFNPFLGAIAFLTIAVFGIWFLEYQSNLSIETIVGVFFAASLALGALITPNQELLEAMLGNISTLSRQESFASIILSIILIAVILAIRKKLALNMVSQELSQSIGIKNKQLEFIYLLIFALAVALGIRFVGALLMGSLVIIPAASAKNIAKSLNLFMSLSVVFGILAAILGIYFSQIYNLSPGPIFILISAAIFILSLFIKKIKK
ncbi:metal ABC transporter permease [Candidatus Wolfebacteria bacterium]|nr:metal ABC transporter permease [Candidatus Wolfebacteria bacterium]